MPLKTIPQGLSLIKKGVKWIMHDLSHPFTEKLYSLRAEEIWGEYNSYLRKYCIPVIDLEDLPDDIKRLIDDCEQGFEQSLEENLSEEEQTERDAFKKRLEQAVKTVLIESPNITFDEIGGQTRAKEEIKFLAYTISNPELYKKWGTRHSRGILLCGPPGNGKTLLAKALATGANANFYNIRLADFMGIWGYETELVLQYILDQARESAKEKKAIVFFDEFDAVGTNRRLVYREPWHGRITSILTSNMDGMLQDGLFYMANTNNIEFIDPALLRAGRFDRIIEMGYPYYYDRKEIIAIHMNKARRMAGRDIYDGGDIELIAERTSEFSGADIAEVIRRASEQKVKDEWSGRKAHMITTSDILEQIERYERKRDITTRVY